MRLIQDSLLLFKGLTFVYTTIVNHRPKFEINPLFSNIITRYTESGRVQTENRRIFACKSIVLDCGIFETSGNHLHDPSEKVGPALSHNTIYYVCMPKVQNKKLNKFQLGC